MGDSLNSINIAVIGAGYVGLSLTCLLAQFNKVYLVDILKEKIDLISEGRAPLSDQDIPKYLSNKTILKNIYATTDVDYAIKNARLVIIATPTTFDESTGILDTSTVETVIERTIILNPNATIIIKSTVPFGFTDRIAIQYKTVTVLFSPEFLREGKALYDNLYPSRIIIGIPEHLLKNDFARKQAFCFARLLVKSSKNDTIPTLVIGAREAEAIKLFSNSYLALRVAFINELDTFAETFDLDTKSIVEGISLDKRIGNYYNNPSFGYGGYCLPKDSKQLLANFKNIPQNLIEAVVDSNVTRKKYIKNRILERLREVNNPILGVYRLTMKAGSDNFRSSAIIDIIDSLREEDLKIIVYEPTITEKEWCGFSVENNFRYFSSASDLVIANRFDDELAAISEKVYTRDIWRKD